MTLLDRLERRFGRYAIHNLTGLIVAGQVVGIFLGWGNAEFLQRWALVPQLVLEGQWWRLITFVFIPPGINILVFFAIYLFFIMGSALEAQWGAFRYNVYVLIAYIATIAAAFLVPGDAATVSYVGGSVFLAFAWLFPDFQILLMFILPVKVKYLAWITWAGYFLTLATGSMMARVLVLASISNFLLFFGYDIVLRVRHGQRTMERAVRRIRQERQAFHECAECGMTEKSDIDMQFRFCSKCDGNFEYCEEHLHNHEHRQSQ